MNLINQILPYIWLIVGFVCLVKGADFFVEGSSSVAKLLKIPPIIIGLTIVAMGTSAPETAVSVSAALSGLNGIAVGNVVGSNFFNLLVVVGICAVLQPVKITKSLLRRDFPFSILVTLLLLGFVYIGSNFAIDGDNDYGIARFSGVALIILFIVYIVMLVHSAIKNREEGESINAHSPLGSVFLIIVGLLGITIGGNLVVNNAKIIAATLGMSEALIGLTVVAFGTSLPELVTSIVAAKKGECDMALGNVIGSNIFNLLLVLGLSSIVHPIELGESGLESIVDLILLTAANIVVLLMVLKNKTLRFKAGIVMLLMYGAYMAYIIARNYDMLPAILTIG
ncbi:MAG: calcium/sodium antiporter [Lachnospirales bacterium]